MAAMDENSRVALAEIRGDVKLVLAGQQRTHDDVQEIRKTLVEHNGRINSLENDRSVRDGERKGITFGGRVLLGIACAIGGGSGVFAIVELLK